MKYHGQLLQDRWAIEQVARHYGSLTGHTFLDIGAHDGKQFSNTFVMETELDWTGVCVEPHPETFQTLLATRRCKCVNVCMAREPGIVQFSPSLDDPMLSKIDPSAANAIPTQALTVDQLAAAYGITDVAYASIDTEGNEYEVLIGMTSIKPYCMTIEHNGDSDKLTNICKWLSNRNYLFRFVEWDIWAIQDTSNWRIRVE